MPLSRACQVDKIPEFRATHRLRAILCADACGYSRLMEADDSGTVQALNAARGVFRTSVIAHAGRVVDTAGDSVLAIFESASGAVHAAIAVQTQLAERSSSIPVDKRLLFRIGIHLGDVIEQADDTVYGDGVNIAARLQALASPSGIAVSEAVRSAVRGRVGATFADLGEQVVKNIAEPVRVFRLGNCHRALANHWCRSARVET